MTERLHAYLPHCKTVQESPETKKIIMISVLQAAWTALMLSSQRSKIWAMPNEISMRATF